FMRCCRPPDPPLFPSRRSSDLAYGMGLADLSAHRQMGIEEVLHAESYDKLQETVAGLVTQTHEQLEQQGVGQDAIADLINVQLRDRKSTRLNSSHVKISYAVFC